MIDERVSSAEAQERSSFPLEEPGPLSCSKLWRLQRRYFESAGVSAWSEGVVPSYVTSNSFIARAYSRVVAAFLRDWGLAEPLRQGNRPVYVVELGAGSGRFAFHFLRKFAELQDLSGGRWPIKYVLTEYNPALIDFWMSHAALQPFVAAGRLDFALFDAERPADLTLRVSGERLAARRERCSLWSCWQTIFLTACRMTHSTSQTVSCMKALWR